MNILFGKLFRILGIIFDKSEVFNNNSKFKMQIIKSIYNEKR